jgi:hypothetical protein
VLGLGKLKRSRPKNDREIQNVREGRSGKYSKLAALAVCCAACAQVAPRRIDPATRESVMRELRMRLGEVARKRLEHGSELVDFEFGRCPHALVGAPQSEVFAALGRPDQSDSCANSSSNCMWQYSFYWSPPHWVGGGPELDVYFDDAGVVSKVECARTQ